MEKLIAKLKEEQYKTPFVSAFVIGLITHLFMIVNKFPNVDSMTNFYFDQNMVTSGRWFLMIACGFSSFYDLNFVNGLLANCFDNGICLDEGQCRHKQNRFFGTCFCLCLLVFYGCPPWRGTFATAACGRLREQ